MREKISLITRTALILAFGGLLLISGNAFAAGGPCPTSTSYLDVATNSLVTLASLGVTSCYYVAANGSDTNSGTSETSPWLHAPYMPNCSGNCATLQKAMNGTAAAGLGFIFRGGDTWHLGNSGALPYTGGSWNFSVSPYPGGTATNPIYVGVDQSWYAGSAWARPILTGDNPLCNASTLSSTCIQDTTHTYEQFYVTSCPYQASSSNVFIGLNGLQYYDIDNFELTGMCESTPGQPSGPNTYVSAAGVLGAITVTNVYIHGWSHVQFAGANATSACTGSAVCFDLFAFGIEQNNAHTNVPADFLQYDVVDGSDSDPVGGGLTDSSGFYSVSDSVFRYTSQCLASSLHIFHDNLYEYFFENGHSDLLWQHDWNGTDAIYNNIFSHLETSGGTNGTGVWPGPDVGATVYFFNNLMYDEGSLNCLYCIGSPESSTISIGPQVLFNNTFENTKSSATGCTCTAGASCPVSFVNNHYIGDTASIWEAGCTQIVNNVTNLVMKHSTAASAGYTASELYAYSPTSASSPTAVAGTNEGTQNSAYCSALSTAASSDPILSDAASACLSDTRYSCTYNSTNHTVTCPARTTISRPASSAWGIGAYQVGNSATPQPPTNVQATPH
jgi:hypothetical protein